MVEIQYTSGYSAYREIMALETNKSNARIAVITTEGEYQYLEAKEIKEVKLFDYGILRGRWVSQQDKFVEGM